MMMILLKSVDCDETADMDEYRDDDDNDTV